MKNITIVKPPISAALSASLRAAKFPDRMRLFVKAGLLVHYFTDKDGSLGFSVPSLTKTEADVDLIWHPEDPATWSVEGERFDVIRTVYRGRGRREVVGSDPIDVGMDGVNTVDDLILWICDISTEEGGE